MSLPASRKPHVPRSRLEWHAYHSFSLLLLTQASSPHLPELKCWLVLLSEHALSVLRQLFLLWTSDNRYLSEGPRELPQHCLLFYNQDLYFFYAFRYNDRWFYFMCLNGTACLVLRLSRGYCQHTVSIYAKSFMVAPFNILLFQAQF